jgi:DNA helicase-2/ATP-dependent DNA helicase PcrA
MTDKEDALNASRSPAADTVKGILTGLTPQQIQAVTHGHGPQVINAGPGAGKTRTLIARVEYLLATGMASPREIVVVTFTNNAARECSERLAASLGRPVLRGMTISTFHSLCSRVLRQHAARVGRSSSFTIYDQRAALALIGYVLADEQRTRVRSKINDDAPCAASVINGEISLAKNRLWSADFYEQRSRHPHASLIAAVWREVDEELAVSNALHLDDLLGFAVRLLGEHQDLQAHYRGRWRWLLVDEVQDTCYAQMGLVRLLAQPAGNLTIVGDTDQALYSFRGAEPRNLLSFPSLFPGRREVALGVNFRSREEIVTAAEQLIVHNRSRPAIEFLAARGAGGHAAARRFENEYAEAGWIIGEISRRLAGGVPAGRILVLARASFALRPVRRALEKAGVKHHVLGSLGLFERAEVKDALSYLALLVNPHDAIALRRAIASPKREIGAKGAAAILEHARSLRIDLLEACASPEEIPRLRARARTKVAVFGRAMLALRAAQTQGLPVSDLVLRALTMDGGLVAHYQRVQEEPRSAKHGEEAAATLELLRELCEAARRYEGLEERGASLLGFLERAAGLYSSAPAIVDEGVRVATIHRAKGTQAKIVFVCGCEENIAPSRYAISATGQRAMEEERCAFYVGMTRAEDALHLSWSAVRQGRQSAGRSRFLTEAGI